VPPSLPVPTPPIAEGTGLPWDVTIGDAVAAIAEARARHGDTFVVHSGRDHYLFTFSPVGVESFYALPEEIASKAIADYLMLRRKLPDEIFDGRRTLPNSLFRRDDVASYLVNLDQALEQTVAELGPRGTVDLFDLTRRLGHRMGLASWAGPGSAQGDTFDRLVAAFDTLDGSDAFVHPDAMAVAASDNAFIVARRRRRARLNRGASWSLVRQPERAVRLIVDARRRMTSARRNRSMRAVHIASMSNPAVRPAGPSSTCSSNRVIWAASPTATTTWRDAARWRVPEWRNARSCRAPCWPRSTSTPAR
jgi:hypothetical protein